MEFLTRTSQAMAAARAQLRRPPPAAPPLFRRRLARPAGRLGRCSVSSPDRQLLRILSARCAARRRWRCEVAALGDAAPPPTGARSLLGGALQVPVRSGHVGMRRVAAVL